eukprot:GHVP01049377.1.p1 GENE.GHVP01049377.1~~GHVP01049377.1.p1  ORF type:complete len:313 (-),score=37.78 GHVP01049377.1:172-1110(-)
MVLVKILKNKAYFSRRQIKFERRRNGKTDYQARRKMTIQDKNKYSSPKYRFVVRRTNSRIICQIISATTKGDIVHCSADSQELKKYGLSFGLTNYAAAYCTGLLCTRRHLKNLGLDSQFVGQSEVDGEDFIQGNEGRRPFKCCLDIGLVGTTTGNRVFGAMKGAVDGGLNIPHNHKRFPGFKKGAEGAEDSFDSSVLRGRIFGTHVAEYMKLLESEDKEAYERQFSDYIKLGVDPDSIEDTYKTVHAKIRENPDFVKKSREHAAVHVREGNSIKTSKAHYLRPKKLTSSQRKARVAAKIAEIQQKLADELEK